MGCDFVSSFSRGKLLGCLVLVVVVVASVGSYVIWNKPAGQTAPTLSSNSVLQTTGVGTEIEASTTATSWSPVQWISVGNVQSVNYYLTLLEANGTEPYGELAKELRSVPDATNATAVAQVIYLALNATNPETTEAFELMIKGGTADPADFSYSIPRYNTELQILYWLAAQRQLKRDDTLALAIAMSNGLWVTIGDSSVQQQVRKDDVDLLDFFRETNDLQRKDGFPQLENLPLEAKVSLAWLGGETGTHGHYGLTGSQTVRDDTMYQLNLRGYSWDVVSIQTLREMRDEMMRQGWVSPSIDETVAKVEDYFFFSGFNEHFDYVSSRQVTIQIWNETAESRNINNANFEFEYYKQTGKGIGVCADEMTLVSAFFKSWGIATLPLESYWFQGDWYDGHSFTMYFDAASNRWKVTPFQIGIVFDLVRDAYIFLPPVLQNQYIPTGKETPSEAIVPYPYQTGEVNTKMFTPMYNITGNYMNRFRIGVDTTQMKQWILYKTRPPIDTTPLVKWSYQGPWTVIPDGSKDLMDQNGNHVGDLGQPYVDLSNVSYSYSNGSLFFRFSLHGGIPSQVTRNVTSIWYQVLLDSDSDSGTGYDYGSRNFTPDYILMLYVSYDQPTNTVSTSSELLKHCGDSSDWCWTEVGFTQHFAKTPLIMGGVGTDSFVLTCDYQDISASSGSTIQFFARTGIMYNGQVYNDPAPDDGTISLTLH